MIMAGQHGALIRRHAGSPVLPAARSGMGKVIQLGHGAHPAKVSVFTDAGSLWHVLFGVLAGLSGPSGAMIGVSGFLAYEVSETDEAESWERTGGKLLEFTIGLVLARLIQMAGGRR